MASIYDKASLVMIPSGTKTSKIFSQKPVSGDGDFTFSRSTAATRVNADGVIEKETQNLLRQSNNFNTTWVKNAGATLVSGQSGYDGSNDAWRINVTTTSNSGLYQYLSSTSSGVNTISLYAKAGDINYIGFTDFAGSNWYIWFDLSNGTIASQSGYIDSSITDVGGGWYRLSMTSTDLVIFQIKPSSVAANPSSSAGYIFIQDAQAEQGLVARDYIETTTTAVEGGITDNVPRLDYTDATCPNLLLEPQRTNLVTNSELGTDLDVQGGGVTNNETTSPEGFNNAYKFLETTYAGNHGTYKQITGLGTGTDYAVSVFVKKLGRRYVGLQSWYGSSDGAIIYVDLDNGTIEDTYAEGTGYSVSKAKIDDYGNGWYRISGVFQSGNSNQYYGLVSMDELWTSGTSYDNVFAGDVTKGFYSYGLQLEAGSYPTSYIPTYGSAVTRNNDYMRLLASDFYSTTSYTYFLDIDLPNDVKTSAALWKDNDNLPTNGGFQLRKTSASGTYVGITTHTGSGWVGFATNVLTGRLKIALRYNNGVVEMWYNGTKSAQTFNVTGWNQSTNHFKFQDGSYGTYETEQFLFIPTALTDQEAIDLTTL